MPIYPAGSRTPIPMPPLDPDAALDYVLDWNDADDPWLASGETVAQAEWTVPAEILIGDGALSQATKAGSVTPDAPSISGGTLTIGWLWPDVTAVVGTTYTVEVTVRSSLGRKDSRSFTVLVANR